MNLDGLQDANSDNTECTEYAQCPGPVYSHNVFPSEPDALGVAMETETPADRASKEDLQRRSAAREYQAMDNANAHGFERTDIAQHPWPVFSYDTLPCESNVPTDAMENHGRDNGGQDNFIDNSVYSIENMHVDRADGPPSLIDTCPTAFVFLSHLDLVDILATPPLSRSPSPKYTPSSPVYIPSSPVLSSPPSPPSSVCACTREADCHAVRACNHPLPLPHSTLSVTHDPDTRICRPMHPPGSHARCTSPDSYDGDNDLPGLVSVSRGNDSSDSESDMDLEDDTDDDDNHLQSECEREDLMRERVEEILIKAMRDVTEEVIEYPALLFPPYEPPTYLTTISSDPHIIAGDFDCPRPQIELQNLFVALIPDEKPFYLEYSKATHYLLSPEPALSNDVYFDLNNWAVVHLVIGPFFLGTIDKILGEGKVQIGGWMMSKTVRKEEYRMMVFEPVTVTIDVTYLNIPFLECFACRRSPRVGHYLMAKLQV
ncbi:hypothetical protein SCP_0508020 [Sparassis crispa]|uniref:Uncharacterized protein n=1 Tax=Sparassis crispa TaxID=139825 RepID=A0A401GNF7_9APHY|nr:hypothetical protein SCP_0508020 [Sparassis crispa]GBE83746.1 hypothetical protein SCP_0508020 [Sparassis crispa]